MSARRAATAGRSNPIAGEGERRVEYMPLDELASALRNPKKHDAQVIASGISKLGMIEIPTIDERTGRLVAGHGRRDDLLARRANGEPPPKRSGIVVDDEGRWLVPTVRGWASRSDNEAHTAGVLLNQATIAGGFDTDRLAELVGDLNAVDESLVAALGFSEQDIRALLCDPTTGFQPDSNDSQPRLDQLEPDMVECPNCGHEWDRRE